MKSIWKPQSKNFKIEEYKNCLDGREFKRECSIYVIRSFNHETYFQQVQKSTLSTIADKRCYESDIESKPWNGNLYFGEQLSDFVL